MQTLGAAGPAGHLEGKRRRGKDPLGEKRRKRKGR
jgi:hypothetical protein